MAMTMAKRILAAGATALMLAGCTTTVVSPGPGPYYDPPRPGPYDSPGRPGPYDPPRRNEPRPIIVQPPRNDVPIQVRPPRNERPPRVSCDARAVAFAIGEPATPGRIEGIARQSGARSARVVRPGMMVTQEFSPDRITISIGRNNRIQSLSCS